MQSGTINRRSRDLEEQRRVIFRARQLLLGRVAPLAIELREMMRIR